MSNLTAEQVAALTAQLNKAASDISVYVATIPAPIDGTALQAAAAAVTAAVPVA